MIIGSCEVNEDKRCVETHRDTYLFETLTVVSVRKPFLAGGLLFGLAFIGFCAAFFDLLYASEILIIAACALAALFFGFETAQLKLLSRDLRGSEISGAVWGRSSALNKKRSDIAAAIAKQRTQTK